MQLLLIHLAGLLYIICALLPAAQRSAITIGTLLAWGLHGVSLCVAVVVDDHLRLGFAVMLSAALWISVGAYWVENRNLSVDGLRRMVLPSAALAIVLPIVFPGVDIPFAGKPPLFSWHIVLSTLAYGCLTVAAFHVVLMAIQESRLHALPTLAERRRWWLLAIDDLPPLLTMERLLFRIIGLGFVLLTLTVISGMFFSELLFGKPFRWEHKTVFTVFSWLLFGVLLAGRYWRGWRGRTALTFTLTGFVTLLLAYVGSRFVLEVVLHRGIS
jgi:ABC-type uncharacterized transport system permease subunit